jgi:hypothetical protein
MAVPSLAPFSAGQILTSDDMNETAEAVNSLGLFIVKTQTIGSAVSSVTVTGAFSSDFDNYKIIISGGVGSTNQDLYLQLSGSSANYYQGQIILAYAGGAVTGAGLAAGSLWTVGFGSSNVLNANVELLGPFLAKPTSFQCARPIQSTTGSSVFISGYHNVNTSYTGLVISTSTGTMTGGTIRVYGYRNSL